MAEFFTNLKQRVVGTSAKERRFSFITLAVLFMVLAIFLVTMTSLSAQAREKNQTIDALESTLAAQREENSRVQTLIDQGDESGYIERIAREKYGYARPEERVYINSDQS